MTYKIYSLLHPETEEIRYVGVTSSNLNRRYSQHIYSGKHRQTKVAKCIYSLSLKGLKPIIKEIEECTENNWEEREVYWISYYENLLNQYPGGKGVILDRSRDSIKRSAEGHYKSVCQIDDEGNLIKIWQSGKQASIELGFKSKSSIINAIKNIDGCHKAGGTRWCYYEDFKNGTINLHPYKPTVNYDNLKKVYLFDIDGHFIKEYLCLYNLTNDLWPTTKSYTTAFKQMNKKRPCKGYYISYDRSFKI